MTELETLRQQLATAEAARKTAEVERNEARLSEDALQLKVDTMADAMNELGLTCGCSVDGPGDLCLHHSPRLMAAVKRAEAAETRVCEVEHRWSMLRGICLQFSRRWRGERNTAEARARETEEKHQKYIEARDWQEGHSENTIINALDLMTKKYHLAAAEAAGAKILLQEYCDGCPARACGQAESNCSSCPVRKVLSSSGPSAAILAVVEAAKKVSEWFWHDGPSTDSQQKHTALRDALRAIDGER